MQETPPDRSAFEQFLHSYGIEIGFLISGFFGALLLVSKKSAQRVSSTVASLLAGTACANYLTPVVLNLLPESVRNGGKYAVAFTMGFIGLKGLEAMIDRWFYKEHEPPILTKKRSSTGKKRRRG